MPAVLHRDELVVPARFNPFNPGAQQFGGNTERLEALVAQLVEDNRAQAGEIARLNARIARIVEKWDIDGMPELRNEEAIA